MSEQATSGDGELRTVLRNQRRRVVAALAAAETIDATPILEEGEHLSSEAYVTLVYELHHVHLPDLQAAGVVDFDRYEETVSRGSNFDEARPLD